MRSRFEKEIRHFSDLAKGEQEHAGRGASEEDVLRFESALNERLEYAARHLKTSKEVQETIYEIQQEKQEVMRWLRQSLACIDDPDCTFESPEGTRPAVYDPEKNIFQYENDKGENEEATVGELMTDMEWGVIYQPDKVSTPRNMLKRYFVELAKHDLRDLLDDQILLSEGEGELSGRKTRSAYRRYRDDKETGVIEQKTGFIAENMVKNTFRKLMYDGGADLEVRESDIYEDVVHKVDFILHRAAHHRGVDVEEHEVGDVGIQFTTNPHAVEEKESGVARSRKELREVQQLDDLVLVMFPLDMARSMLRNWRDAGRPAGGPDKMLARQIVHRIIEEVSRGMFDAEEIEEAWERIKPQYGKKKSQYKNWKKRQQEAA